MIGDADDVANATEIATWNDDGMASDFGSYVHAFYEEKRCVSDGEEILSDCVFDFREIGCVF